MFSDICHSLTATAFSPPFLQLRNHGIGLFSRPGPQCQTSFHVCGPPALSHRGRLRYQSFSSSCTRCFASAGRSDLCHYTASMHDLRSYGFSTSASRERKESGTQWYLARIRRIGSLNDLSPAFLAFTIFLSPVPFRYSVADMASCHTLHKRRVMNRLPFILGSGYAIFR